MKIYKNSKEFQENCKNMENLFEKQKRKLEDIMENWIKQKITPGQMRNLRGEDIENFVLETINLIGKKEKINLEAKKGKFDKKSWKLMVLQKNIRMIFIFI